MFCPQSGSQIVIRVRADRANLRRNVRPFALSPFRPFAHSPFRRFGIRPLLPHDNGAAVAVQAPDQQSLGVIEQEVQCSA
jgi:hypothetical protein